MEATPRVCLRCPARFVGVGVCGVGVWLCVGIGVGPLAGGLRLGVWPVLWRGGGGLYVLCFCGLWLAFGGPEIPEMVGAFDRNAGHCLGEGPPCGAVPGFVVVP